MYMHSKSSVACAHGARALLCALVVAAAGCASEAVPTEDVVGSTSEELTQEIAFSEFVDPKGIGNAGQTETRVVVSSKAQYALLFGHAAPASIDFAKGERVFFYSAGVKNTGGYAASVQRIVKNDFSLKIHTHLESPGAGCIVTQALTKPHVLVKYTLSRRPLFLLFAQHDDVRDCEEEEGGLTCEDVSCDAGSHCELVQVVCIRAPCYPVPTCIEDNAPPTNPCITVKCTATTHCQANPDGTAGCVPNEQFCGGIAAFPCPGAGVCIDNPGDGCSPQNGGADCGGICKCAQTKLCPIGTKFDSSPSVCVCK